jgi:hypothetical protein
MPIIRHNQKFLLGFAIGLVVSVDTIASETAGAGIAATCSIYTSMLLFIIDFIAVFVTIL